MLLGSEYKKNHMFWNTDPSLSLQNMDSNFSGILCTGRVLPNVFPGSVYAERTQKKSFKKNLSWLSRKSTGFGVIQTLNLTSVMM